MRKGRCRRQLRQSAQLSAGAHSSSVEPDMRASHHGPRRYHQIRQRSIRANAVFWAAIHFGDDPFMVWRFRFGASWPKSRVIRRSTMGQLVDGKWQDVWYSTKEHGGRFVRSEAPWRDWVTAD